jgi:hypothetical protein
LRVKYNLRKAPGERVVSVETRCAHSRIPHYHHLDVNEEYGLILNQYIADGGDGFRVFVKHGKNKTVLEAQEGDILADFFRKKSPVWTGIEGRIEFLGSKSDSGAGKGAQIAPKIFIYSISAAILFYFMGFDSL